MNKIKDINEYQTAAQKQTANRHAMIDLPNHGGLTKMRKQPKRRDTPKQLIKEQLKNMGEYVAPKVAKADRPKVKHIVVAIRSAKAVGEAHAANSLRFAKSGESFNRIDPIAAIANAIDKFSRLNPAVLKGGQALKDYYIAEAWKAYSVLETSGLDNAHFTETQIPVDQRMDIDGDGCNEAGFISIDYNRNDECAYTGKASR